ncbi:broad-spectrum mercury transporter MerE [Rheinheimera sp.]|uniref:broad-spectrum mercury transporter MerE n=1 Tax=Rheinheimera sp. TaxID=1869214 RepID=UPI004047714F
MSKTTSTFQSYIWGALALLFCPCHLPILMLLLSGTTVGALLGEYPVVSALVMVALFGLAAVMTVRGLRRQA